MKPTSTSNAPSSSPSFNFYVAHRGLLTSASLRRKTCVFAPASQPDRNTHGPGVRPEKTRCWKGQRTLPHAGDRRAGCYRNKTLADRARERGCSRVNALKKHRVAGKKFRQPFQRLRGSRGSAPGRAPQSAKPLGVAKSAGGDSASRSPRDRARCGGPTRREGSPGREDLTSFLHVRSGAALEAVL